MEVVIVTSSKDGGGGMAALDVATGSAACPIFKNCIAESGTISIVGGPSSYAGKGLSCDYIVAPQAKKPQVNVWHFGKPQVHMQCHVQEILASTCVDAFGCYLIGGAQSGWCYCWELSTGTLLHSWRAHFKAVTRIKMTSCGTMIVTVSDDGIASLWDLASIVDETNVSGKRHIQPFRNWSPHSLPVRDSFLLGASALYSSFSLRVVTCSLDRTVVLQDVMANQQIFRTSLPESLECLSMNSCQDVIYCGSSSGNIYLIDVSASAIAVSNAHANIVRSSNANKSFIQDNKETTNNSSGSGYSGAVLKGHSMAVTSLAFSNCDNKTLVSVSLDCTLRVWDVMARQCVREIKPLNKVPLTNVVMVWKPEYLLAGITKPSMGPFGHLKKFTEGHETGSKEGLMKQTHHSVVLGPRIVGSSNSHITDSGVEAAPSSEPIARSAAAQMTQDSDAGFVALPKSYYEMDNSKRSKKTLKAEAKEQAKLHADMKHKNNFNALALEETSDTDAGDGELGGMDLEGEGFIPLGRVGGGGLLRRQVTLNDEGDVSMELASLRKECDELRAQNMQKDQQLAALNSK